MKLAIRVDTKNIRVGIHAVTCSARRGRHTVEEIREAASPEELAAEFAKEQDLVSRGLAYPKICPCCKA